MSNKRTAINLDKFIDGDKDKLAIGKDAGSVNQGNYGVALGKAAGYSNQGSSAVAIGDSTANDDQGSSAVAIGNGSGNQFQGEAGVAIGNGAGKNYQGSKGIAIGEGAGETEQGTDAIAIGTNAGEAGQGRKSIAIGYRAGKRSQAENSIGIGTDASPMRVGEILIDNGVGKLQYNPGNNTWDLSNNNKDAKFNLNGKPIGGEDLYEQTFVVPDNGSGTGEQDRDNPYYRKVSIGDYSTPTLKYVELELVDPYHMKEFNMTLYSGGKIPYSKGHMDSSMVEIWKIDKFINYSFFEPNTPVCNSVSNSMSYKLSPGTYKIRFHGDKDLPITFGEKTTPLNYSELTKLNNKVIQTGDTVATRDKVLKIDNSFPEAKDKTSTFDPKINDYKPTLSIYILATDIKETQYIMGGGSHPAQQISSSVSSVEILLSDDSIPRNYEEGKMPMPQLIKSSMKATRKSDKEDDVVFHGSIFKFGNIKGYEDKVRMATFTHEGVRKAGLVFSGINDKINVMSGLEPVLATPSLADKSFIRVPSWGEDALKLIESIKYDVIDVSGFYIGNDNANPFIGGDTYTKKEADDKFVKSENGKVLIGSQNLDFSMPTHKGYSAPRGPAPAPRVGGYSGGDTPHGNVNITEDGLDIKSNYSVNVVINKDNAGEAFYRLYTGSGRKRLLEIGESAFTYGPENHKVYHEGYEPSWKNMKDKPDLATKLDKNAKAADSSKLEGKTKDQVVAEARTGLATKAQLDTAVAESAYGVGDYWITESIVNPATKWPGTTWTKLEGRILLGSSSGYALGTQGGKSTVALTLANIAAHTHGFSGTTNTTGNHYHQGGKHRHKVDNHVHTDQAHTHSMSMATQGGKFSKISSEKTYAKGPSHGNNAGVHNFGNTTTAGGTTSGGSSPYTDYQNPNTSTIGNHAHTISGTIGSSGSGSSFNIMNPYRTVNIWRRTS